MKKEIKTASLVQLFISSADSGKGQGAFFPAWENGLDKPGRHSAGKLEIVFYF